MTSPHHLLVIVADVAGAGAVVVAAVVAAPCAVTMAVGTDDANAAPDALRACTLKRMVLPTSAEVSV